VGQSGIVSGEGEGSGAVVPVDTAVSRDPLNLTEFLPLLLLLLLLLVVVVVAAAAAVSPRSRVLFEKPLVTPLLTKFSELYGTERSLLYSQQPPTGS
jgi:hypothetical protein